MSGGPWRWSRPTSADYATIILEVDDWWGGRAMRDMLPRLFIEHFADTSWVVYDSSAQLAAFLIGFRSPADPTLTYVHFVGVAPAARGHGLGRELYDRFCVQMATLGCTRVAAVTAPTNTTSLSFHTALGFTPKDSPVTTPSGTPYIPDYDGPGEDRVYLTRSITVPAQP